MTPDVINGALEAAGGIAVLNHCRKLYEQKQVRGVSAASVAFFVVWGVWNLYYYPFLDQFWSFAGAVFITVANALYVGLMLRYRDGISVRQVWVFIGKWRAGYRPGHELWAKEDQQVFDALWKASCAVRSVPAKLVCLVRGHRYDTPVFMSNCLYFCTCCGRELLDRSFDDIQPLSDEEREMLGPIDAYADHPEARA